LRPRTCLDQASITEDNVWIAEERKSHAGFVDNISERVKETGEGHVAAELEGEAERPNGHPDAKHDNCFEQGKKKQRIWILGEI
jgi:hypothetical protein